MRLGKSFGNRAEALLFIESCENRKREKDFFARSCLPFWSFLSAFENSKETSDSLSSLKKVNSSHKDLLKIQLPLSSKEVIEILGKPPGPELGKVLDQLRRKFLNGKLQTPEEMRAYLNSKK